METANVPDQRPWVMNPSLLRAIGRALDWLALLDAGAVARNGEIAEREELGRSTVTRLQSLALFMPANIELCLTGQHPRTLCNS